MSLLDVYLLVVIIAVLVMNLYSHLKKVKEKEQEKIAAEEHRREIEKHEKQLLVKVREEFESMKKLEDLSLEMVGNKYYISMHNGKIVVLETNELEAKGRYIEYAVSKYGYENVFNKK